MITKIRIAILISHPIQHFCPQYVSFAENEDVEFKVFFASTLGYRKYLDVNFRKEISWNNLNLDKFDHMFLNGDALIQPDKDLDAPSLEAEMNLYRPGLVFIYGYFQKFQRRAYKWAIKNKVPIAYISDSELRHKRNALKDMLKSIYLRYYFSRVHYFLSMGNANEEYYRSLGVKQERVLRMHYPIDMNQYKNSYLLKQALCSKIRSQYGLGSNDIVLSVVGKLVKWKSQDHIIEAIEILETEGIYLHLFVLGSGEMQQQLEQMASRLSYSKVYFPGFVNIEELPAYYAATDIYVHPASMEPHSVAISEAIAMGCPIIISDRCGSYGDDDDVQVGRNGYTYKFGNIEELAMRINSLAEDEVKRKQFSQYSHDLSIKFQHNSHSTILKKLISRMCPDQHAL